METVNRKFSLRKIMSFLATLAMVLSINFSFVPQASAECCSHSSLFGCCGKGSCNIFCCNCDGGCVPNCTFCSPVVWAECAPKLALCAIECAVTDGAACITCMGASYPSCSACITGASLTAEALKTGNTARPTCTNRDQMYSDIAGVDGKPDGISPKDFAAFVAKQKEARGLTKTTAPLDTIFKAYDVNKNGLIDRAEMDAENVGQGFVQEEVEKTKKPVAK